MTTGEMAMGAAGLAERLAGPGPKRALALDGGGARMALTVGVLAELERRLERRSGRRGFRLCDYFDLIGGASGGALLAALLAIGRSAAELAQIVRDLIPRSPQAGRRVRFDPERLDQALRREFGDAPLGAEGVRTGLAVFAKRIDTGALITVTNNPAAPAWSGDDGGFPQRDMLLRKVIQASLGGPTGVDERQIRLSPPAQVTPAGRDPVGFFVDAAVGGLDNPALQLLQVATMAPYAFNWTPGDQTLMVMSVGAGYWRPMVDEPTLAQWSLDPAPQQMGHRISAALTASLHDSGLMATQLMQALCASPRPWVVNDELKDMRGAQVSPVPLAHFQRFDARLDVYALGLLGLHVDEREVAALRVQGATDAASLNRLHDIGQRAGQAYFRSSAGAPPQPWERSLFPQRFDPPGFSGGPAGPPVNRLQALARAFERRAES